MREELGKALKQASHILIAALPLVAGWFCGTAVKVWLLARAAFIEGYEVGRRL